MLTAAIDGLSDCITWSVASAEPRGALLTGIGGAGKTTVCRAILKSFPSVETKEADLSIKTVPAFYASVPSPSTIGSLAASLLVSIGDPLPPRGTAANLTARLAHLLKICRTQVILLDEFHNLLAEAVTGQTHAKKVCNWLRSLINETGVMVCLVGDPSCETLVNHDHQMSRRFAYRYRLKELDPGTQERPGDLVGFLTGFSELSLKKIQMTSGVDFSDHHRVQQVWAATGGNPAFVAMLFKEAASIALLNGGRTAIELDDLGDAFEKGITLPAALISGNPFLLQPAVLRSKLKKVR